MEADKILELAKKKSIDLSKDIEQIFAVLWKIESLPDKLVKTIEVGQETKHAGEIAFVSGVAAFSLSQLFFALAVKVFRINGLQENSIHDLLSSIENLEETEKT